MAKAAAREGFVDEEAANVTPLKADAAEQANDAPPEGDDEQPTEFKWPMRIRLLHRPIRNNKNEEIRELSFREPTGGDINRYGSPVRLSPDGAFDVDDKKMAMMMAGLSGINLPFLERMDPRDWQSCVYRLRLFFHPDATGWL